MDATRREWMKTAGIAMGALAMQSAPAQAANYKTAHLSTNQYSWTVYSRRDDFDFGKNLDKGLAKVAASGYQGFEPGLNSPNDLDRMGPLLKQHGLEIRSIYVNSVLHEAAQAEESIIQVAAIAEKAGELGTKIVVTNPSPIRWGSGEDKTDDQLKVQAEAMNKLGERLAKHGQTLAYHNHDAELRNAAREFHHMMVGTEPQRVRLCLDSHWIYRGAGDSSVALFDVVKLYADRITEWHLRQSQGGVWSETFTDGDIDYPALAKLMKGLKVTPHYVMEQACEKGTPRNLNAQQVHEKSAHYFRNHLG